MSDEPEAPPTVGRVVGENLRLIRQKHRLTQDQAAAELVRTGLNWKRTQVSDLESGRRETVDLGALVVLAQAFEAPLRDFFAGDGDVLLTPKADHPEFGATATREELRAWFSAEDSSITVTGRQSIAAAMERWRWEGREIAAEADVALAKRLGVDPWKVIRAAEHVWSRSLTEERDRRVAELGDLPVGERQAKQGHITRQLTAILIKQMDGEGEAEDG